LRQFEEQGKKAQAIDYFRKSAKFGNAWAMNILGCAYAEGDGVIQDKAESFKWFLAGSHAGLSEAQKNLGYAYLAGVGVPIDFPRASS